MATSTRTVRFCPSRRAGRGRRRSWTAHRSRRGSAASIAARCGSSHGGSLSAVPSCVQRLVERESGRDRRHLEQHAARLAEVDRVEVRPVANLGDLQPVLEQLARGAPAAPRRCRSRRRRDGPSRGRSARPARRAPRPGPPGVRPSAAARPAGAARHLVHDREAQQTGHQLERRGALAEESVTLCSPRTAMSSGRRRPPATAAAGRRPTAHELDHQPGRIAQRSADARRNARRPRSAATPAARSRVPPGVDRRGGNRERRRDDLPRAVDADRHARRVGKRCPDRARRALSVP